MDTSENHYQVLAYYHLTPLQDPHEEVRRHKAFFEGRDVTGRIYISSQGINGQMSGHHEDAKAYREWMHQDQRFQNMEFKIHTHFENVFPRMTVKFRKQLVALDIEVDLEKRGEHLSPQRWKEMMETEEDYVLIDVRNEYEWRIGHFEGSELPACDMFREFPQYAKKLKEEIDPQKTKVMMCCTGGIRCEFYSALLKEEGFEEVYQLQGGIIKYAQEAEGKHWKGKLFVFDDRLAIPVNTKDDTVLSHCLHCGVPNDTYYNCANMDCNELFLCCPECLHKFKGCCEEECTTASRLRPHHQATSHKPFRKGYHYLDEGKKVGQSS